MILRRLRAWWNGNLGTTVAPEREQATTLIRKLAHGELRRLSDPELVDLAGVLLSTPHLREPLRGNARFLESVAAQYARKRTLSVKQRFALYNILERAYPHNLAVHLLKL